jgi:deoxyadenosine/deoxycytidine kinase
MNYQIQIVSIEGNIGSGKSTLLANLKKHFNNNKFVLFLREPIDEWSKIKDENNITILEKFYSEQNKYSFSFQMMAYISRLKLLKDTFKDIQLEIQKLKNINSDNNYSDYKFIIITERSLFTDKMVFAKMLYDSGKIENVNYQIYLNWFDTFADEFPINKIIYVKTEPLTCYERIATRHRDGESNIPIEYLNLCSEYHDKMLDKYSHECICNDQLILNGNHNIYQNENILEEWIKSIEKFI